ncbi:MAG: translation elongation factor Ts [Pseudomonadota bacterium]|nr:translation elongation factor Ts [Pseudomonadota bacterium]
MEISATTVKTLRERTGAGMMECKKALITTAGDIEKAIDLMRTSGIAKAATKANRIAAEGVIAVTPNRKSLAPGLAAMVEVNCETDFVSRGDEFQAFAEAVAACVLRHRPIDLAALLALPLDPGADSVESARGGLIAKIGENITVRRFALMSAPKDGRVGVYRHGTRIGVLVALEGGDVATDLAKDIAMHIAWSRPVSISEADVPQALMDREREIFKAQAAETGKSHQVVEKIVAGKIEKFLNEVTLLGQPFVKATDKTPVARILADAKATVRGFERFEVGEGIQKKAMAEARGE